jgi:hypothetical protein
MDNNVASNFIKRASPLIHEILRSEHCRLQSRRDFGNRRWLELFEVLGRVAFETLRIGRLASLDPNNHPIPGSRVWTNLTSVRPGRAHLVDRMANHFWSRHRSPTPTHLATDTASRFSLLGLPAPAPRNGADVRTPARSRVSQFLASSSYPLLYEVNRRSPTLEALFWSPHPHTRQVH